MLIRWSLGHFTYSSHLIANEKKSRSLQYVVSAEQTYCTQLNRNQINTHRMEMVPSARKHVRTSLRMYVNTYICVCVCMYVFIYAELSHVHPDHMRGGAVRITKVSHGSRSMKGNSVVLVTSLNATVQLIKVEILYITYNNI